MKTTAKLVIKTGNTTPPNAAAGQASQAVGKSVSARQSDDYVAKHTKLIAECAYFSAEKRNFTGGDPIQDWLIAEREIGCSHKH